MLERLLSPRGFKLHFAVALIMSGYLVWQYFTYGGIADWINRLQATYLLSGYYYPELTIIILAIPVMVVSFAIGFSHDYLTGQGIFAGQEKVDDLASPSSSMKIEYQATMRKEMIDQVRSKFQAEIYQLKMLGFEEFGFYREIVPWFGLPMGFMGLLGAVGVLSNEITRIGPKLTINAFYILMASRKDAAYADVSKLGIKFYSGFTDGTCINTAAYKGIEFEDEAQRLYRIASSGPLPSTWAEHKQWISKLQTEGKRVNEDLNMPDYFQMFARLDNHMLKNHSKIIKKDIAKEASFASNIIPALVSVIITLGIFASVFFAFALPINLMHNFYPLCGFAIMPLWINFLGVPAFMGISWLLALTQRNLSITNGYGALLYGNDPASAPEQFISTSWLSLVAIPLLPVRSYIVTVTGTDALGKKTYETQPLDKINWAQVRQTIRKSWIGYGALALIYSITAWAFLECR
jgi:hypothetical protein